MCIIHTTTPIHSVWEWLIRTKPDGHQDVGGLTDTDATLRRMSDGTTTEHTLQWFVHTRRRLCNAAGGRRLANDSTGARRPIGTPIDIVYNCPGFVVLKGSCALIRRYSPRLPYARPIGPLRVERNLEICLLYLIGQPKMYGRFLPFRFSSFSLLFPWLFCTFHTCTWIEFTTLFNCMATTTKSLSTREVAQI